VRCRARTRHTRGQQDDGVYTRRWHTAALRELHQKPSGGSGGMYAALRDRPGQRRRKAFNGDGLQLTSFTRYNKQAVTCTAHCRFFLQRKTDAKKRGSYGAGFSATAPAAAPRPRPRCRWRPRCAPRRGSSLRRRRRVTMRQRRRATRRAVTTCDFSGNGDGHDGEHGVSAKDGQGA
jgi:hypothetical protein